MHKHNALVTCARVSDLYHWQKPSSFIPGFDDLNRGYAILAGLHEPQDAQGVKDLLVQIESRVNTLLDHDRYAHELNDVGEHILKYNPY